MPGSALILVENLSVPFDRRVQLECRALRNAGWDVTVVCPRGVKRDLAAFELVDGVAIHRFPLRFSDGSPLGFVREYLMAMWSMWKLVGKIARSKHIDVVHACNPPDFLLLAALRLKRRGARFVFDHHDLVPELYLSRFDGRKDPLYAVLVASEKLAFRLADIVIATNESYRRVAVERGRKRPEAVFVVRNGPDLSRFRPVAADPSLKHGRAHLVGYIGVMGPQDGVDYALRALAHLATVRHDWQAVFIGEGDVWEEMKQLATELDLDERVTFTGRIPDDEVMRILSTCDVCLAPDPRSPLNDVSTMTKILEYMALGRPVVSFDLVESRVSAGAAALYAEPNDVVAFAARVGELLGDPDRRRQLGDEGRRRVESGLSWAHSERQLIRAYESALALRRSKT